MKMNRRKFNLLAASMVAASVSLGGREALGALSPISAAELTLNRLTFGATPDSILVFEALGKSAWLDAQFSAPIEDKDLHARLAAARLPIEYEAGSDGDNPEKSWPARNEALAYQYLQSSGADLLRLVDFDTTFIDWEERIRPAREVQSAVFIRATHSNAQLREVMTQFWHDHFNVNSQAHGMTAAYFAQYDTMLRRNALGNFRQMLGEMTKSPAMLFYLNNEASEASPANENFARELLELHTLGAPHYVNGQYANWAEVPGARQGMATGFLDEDVYEVARAFTGWTFGDGRYLQEGTNAPLSGEFLYVDSWHDPYQKRVLGHELPPNSGPMEDGEAVLDLLAVHPGTAKYVCEKICRRLLMDHPPQDLIDMAAQVFLANSAAPDQISAVIRAIVMSDTFDATPARKLKRPFEFLISIYRRAGAQLVSPKYDLAYQLAVTGWSQHEFRPPTGHSDLSEDWANTSALNGMVLAATMGLEPELIGSEMDFESLMGAQGQTWGSALTFWFERFGGMDDPKETATQLLAQHDIAPDAPLAADEEETAWILRSVIGLGALTPKFMFR